MPLARLEALRTEGEAALLAFLAEETGKTPKALVKALAPQADLLREGALRAACDNDDALLARVAPFAGLIRDDSFGRPVVIPGGGVYVTSGTDRRSSGTHYTPRSLTEPIVQHTLDPLVYVGPAEGKPKEEWQLRSAADILGLTVCDMAMGSGAFLVQACRYLSERLVESWEEAEKRAQGRVVVTPEGALSTGAADERPLPRDADERLAIARRVIADRCLYGVDKNPLAVEMGKLSLWLITLQEDRPFTFLDHRLRCGDSLLGVGVEQLTRWSLDHRAAHQLSWLPAPVKRALNRALELRNKIAATSVIDARDAQTKARLLAEAESAMALVRLGANLLISSALEPNLKRREKISEDLLSKFTIMMNLAEDCGPRMNGAHREPIAPQGFAELNTSVKQLLGNHRPFHWPLEFPEIFIASKEHGAQPGFRGRFITP